MGCVDINLITVLGSKNFVLRCPISEEGWIRFFRLPSSGAVVMFTLSITHDWIPYAPGNLILCCTTLNGASDRTFLNVINNTRAGISFKMARIVEDPSGYRYFEMLKTDSLNSTGKWYLNITSPTMEAISVLEPVVSSASDSKLIGEIDLTQTLNSTNMTQNNVIEHMGGGGNSFFYWRLLRNCQEERRVA